MHFDKHPSEAHLPQMNDMAYFKLLTPPEEVGWLQSPKLTPPLPREWFALGMQS